MPQPRVSEAGSVSLSLFHSTPRFSIHLVTLFFIPEDGKLSFISALTARGGWRSAENSEGSSTTYMTGMYEWRERERDMRWSRVPVVMEEREH